MTRPQIIRAGTATPLALGPHCDLHVLIRELVTDTLDLQDKTSPTAQDHSRQPQHPAPLGAGPAAPHQQASLRQVDNERLSEESNLQNDAWGNAKTLREDPGSDDERTIVASSDFGDHDMQRDEQAVRLNGGMSGTADDTDMHDVDADDDDMDDDMMDKISSSPSIDDGGYLSPSLPTTPPGTTPSQTSESPATPESSSVNSSSPFTTTPIHFPLSLAAARRPLGVPASSAERASHSSHSPSPTPFLSGPSSRGHNESSEHHHGEYPGTSGADLTLPDRKPDHESDVSPRTERLIKVEDRLQNGREESHVSLLSDLDEGEVERLLQPALSPIAESCTEVPQYSLDIYEITEEGDGDNESWTTDSDADSWDGDTELDSIDDDSDDVLFSKDSRYVDSAWGGECLREIEDIDFEFVYALHTFVATVEGQANATKGDTMVLLDDSNSYWWLVRVVKDSSIGMHPLLSADAGS